MLLQSKQQEQNRTQSKKKKQPFTKSLGGSRLPEKMSSMAVPSVDARRRAVRHSMQFISV
jgi:hypothetical protein